MARNLFASSPLENELNREDKALGTGATAAAPLDAAAAPPTPGTGPVDYHQLARETQTPYNVIQALTDAAALKDQAQKDRFAREAATRIGRQIKAGHDVPTALKNILGKDAPVNEVLDAADKIAKGDSAAAAPVKPAKADNKSAPKDASLANEAVNYALKGNPLTGAFYQDSSPEDHATPAADLKHGAQRVVNSGAQVVASAPQAAAIAREGTEKSVHSQSEAGIKALDRQIAGLNSLLADPKTTDEDRKAIEGDIAQAQHRRSILQQNAQKTSNITPADQTDLYKSGKKLSDAVKSIIGEAPKSNSFAAQLEQGIGSTFGFAAVGLLAEALGGPVAGTAAIMGMGAAANGQQAYEQAKQSGATEDQALTVAGWNGLMGTSEALPIGHALEMIPNPVVRNMVSKKLFKFLGHIGVSMGEEGIQEGAQQIVQNLVAKHVYDPHQGIMQGVGEQALVGALSGGILSGAFGTHHLREEDQATVVPQPGDQQPQDQGPQPQPEAPQPAAPQPGPDAGQGSEPAPQPAPPAPAPATPDATSEPAPADAAPAPPEPGPISKAAAVAPAPLTPHLVEGQPATVDVAGGTPIPVTFVSAEPDGVNVMYGDTPYFISRGDLESGSVAVNAAQAPQEAQPAAPQEAPAEPQPQPEAAQQPDMQPAQAETPAMDEKAASDAVQKAVDAMNVPLTPEEHATAVHMMMQPGETDAESVVHHVIMQSDGAPQGASQPGPSDHLKSIPFTDAEGAAADKAAKADAAAANGWNAMSSDERQKRIEASGVKVEAPHQIVQKAWAQIPLATRDALAPHFADAAIEKPTGKAHKLADELSKQDQATLAKNRDTNAGEVIGELDNAYRRAEAALRQQGHTPDQFNEHGQHSDGSFNQNAGLMKEAAAHAADILHEVRKNKTGDLPYPPVDEATGEHESDGSAMSNALDFLTNFEANGVNVDTVDEPVSGPSNPDLAPMPDDKLFPERKGTVNLDAQAARQGTIPQAEADARVAGWKAAAAKIGKEQDNSQKVIVSLFDYTGEWSQPWVDAGYQVIRHDVKSGTDMLSNIDFVLQRIEDYRASGLEVYGVLAATPCTTFAGSGARWWKTLHDVDSPEMLVKVFGRDAPLSGAKSALEYNLMLVKATRDVIQHANPTGFHVLENPIGRIQKAADLPAPTIRFEPHNFGDPYTKRTQIFGEMQADLPFANVEATEGSKMQSQLRGDNPVQKEQRSTTPAGFAYAFFMANDPSARAMPEQHAAAEAQPKPAEKTPEAPKAQPETAKEQPAPTTSEAPAEQGGAVEQKLRDAMKSEPVEHVTKKGKTLRGWVVPGLKMAEAKVIDKYTFRKGNGHFIREAAAKDYAGAQAAEPAKAPEAAPKEKWRKIGENRRGNPVYEDENGVRSYTDHGVRVTESVGVVPGGGIEVPAHDKRESDYLTKEELAARQEAAKPKPAAARPDTQPFRDAGLEVSSESDSGIVLKHTQQGEGGVTRTYTARVFKPTGQDAWQIRATRSTNYNDSEHAGVTNPPDKQLGTFETAADALKAMREDGMAEGTPPAKSSDYGAKNTLISKDRAEEVRKKLAEKLRNQLSAGIDPEILSLGTELAAFHMEAGARKFMDFAHAVAGDLGTTVEKVKPYLRAWYNGARDMMEDSGMSIEGMDSADQVAKQVKEIGAAPQETQATEPVKPAETAKPDRETVADAFEKAFSDGEAFANITQARKLAAEALGRDITEADYKTIEEGIEEGVVRSARKIAWENRSDSEVYDALVDLYKRQPLLSERTSTSIREQAYSTPAPLAFVASRLASIMNDNTVYEPTVGNGMLLIEANPKKVTANELNPDRFAAVQRTYPGATVTEGNAMEAPLPSNVDRVIANPPFGKVKGEDGATIQHALAGFEGSTTSEIDHAIAFRALSAMKDDGRAVLIVGGMQGTPKERVAGYRGDQWRKFYKRLYDTYNVAEHFTVDGDLYKRQGAAWPVDVIVIHGRGKSLKPLPMREAPPIYSSWAELRSRIDGERDSLDPRGERELPGRGETAPGNAQADAGGLQGRPGQSDRPAGEGSASERPRPAGDGGAADVGQRPADAAQEPGGSRQPSGDGQRDAAQQGDGQSGVAGQGAAENGPAGGASPESGDVGGVREPAVSVEERKAPKRENTEAETNFQVQYNPHSAAQFAVGTLVPKNMQQAVDHALNDLKSRVGNTDNYVAKNLGYSLDELLGTKTSKGRFSAEQVDALALAINEVENGNGFIIGDQTGVGKGRVVAGMIRYAMKKGMTPVFFTAQPGLYGDMIRDLRDIGEQTPEDYVFPTNFLRGKDAIPLSSDPADVLRSETKPKQTNAMRLLAHDGQLPEGKKVIFSTYDQMNTDRGNVTDRMRAMDKIAPNAFFILDEAHQAGGTGTNERGKKDDAQPRSEFIRSILAKSQQGTFYSSATFAKNPHVMTLYFKTNLRLAVPDMKALADVVQKGGIPLQQVISKNLVEDGQYMRRERTYEGIEMRLDQMPTDSALAATSSNTLREMFLLDQGIMSEVRAGYIEEMQNEGNAGATDNAVGNLAATSVNFSSTMHNTISQMLLAIKADATIASAAEAYARGEKPIIALSNTNASIIDDYAKSEGIEIGDKLDIPFNTILQRYLDRMRRITVKDENDKKTHIHLTDNDIIKYGGKFALDEVKRVERIVQQAYFHGMPASPIDYIREGLARHGMNVGEVTGRNTQIVDGKYERRKASQAENKRQMNAYNAGGLDALIINRSGATGFSMHATDAADNDGKVRHMFILQPEPNIDLFMQMLGRVNRTGQIKLPKYTIAVSDLAVEKRPAAVLMRKMASLNANTTANKSSAVSLNNVTDFMNQYGDQIVASYLRENPELADLTGVEIPAKGNTSGIAAKFTGKLAILDPKETARIYDDIEENYRAYIEELDALGQNALEAKTLPLDAKTVSRSVIAQGEDPHSAFGKDAVLENANVRVIGKPYSSEQVNEIVDKLTAKRDATKIVEDDIASLDAEAPPAREKLNGRIERAKEAYAAAKTKKAQDKAADQVRKAEAALDQFNGKLEEVKGFVRGAMIGRPVILQTRGEGGQTAQSVYGVMLGVDLSKLKGNPTSASRAMVRIAIANPSRELRVPISRFIGQDSEFDLLNARVEAAHKAFDAGQAELREDRQIVSGNIIAGLNKFGRGQIVFFTREDGSTDQGILLPKEFDANAALRDASVQFHSVDQAMEFLDKAGGDRTPSLLTSSDDVLRVNRLPYGGYQVTVAKRGGKPYILSPKATELVGDFRTRGKEYSNRVNSPEKMKALLQVYKDTLGTELVAKAHKDEARAITGEKLPTTEAAPDAAKRKAVATLTGDELGAHDSMSALRKAGLDWYRKNLVGTTVTNSETGWKITFSRRGANKTVNATGEDLVRMIPAIPAIIRDGRVVATEDSRKSERIPTAYHKIGARVILDGKAKDVVVTVRQNKDGTYHYDLSRDMSDGARFRKTAPAAETGNARRSDTALEGNPVTLNIEVSDAADNPTTSKATGREMRALRNDLLKELRAAGIDHKIGLHLNEKAFNFGPGYSALDGYFLDGTIGVAADAPDGAKGILRHEIIHALRSPDLWGSPYGLFTKGEWTSLVREARRRTDIRAWVDQAYPNLTEAKKNEEVIAEMYREWGDKMDARSAYGKALDALHRALRAIVTVLRGHGANRAADVFDSIRQGKMADRADEGLPPRDEGGRFTKSAEGRKIEELAAAKRKPADFAELDPVKASNVAEGERGLLGHAMTQAMDAIGGFNALTLVPGRPLINELGKNISALQSYLATKEKMDTVRNEMHAEFDKTAQMWRKMGRHSPKENQDLMDLMHDSTIAQQDPTIPYLRVSEPRDPEIVRQFGPDSALGKAAADRLARDRQRRKVYDAMRERFKSLPEDMQDLYRRVRDEYKKMGQDFEDAIVYAAEKAMRLAAKRAEERHQAELQRIEDEGLRGKAKADAIAEAEAKLKMEQMQARFAKEGRVRALRKQFERNRLQGPYFPLARFGNFYVTAKQGKKIVSFSKFEKAKDQAAFAKEMRDLGYNVETGVMDAQTARKMVDPQFAANVAGLLEEATADKGLMDDFWQMYLKTLPDMSLRTRQIHRKGTPGFVRDALRAYGDHMFHAAHQLARLRYTVDMEEHLQDARKQVKQTADPVRAGLVLNEVERRHEFIMNPRGSKLAQNVTTGTFIYYLGFSPSSAAVNLSQTTVVGIPILGAFHGGARGVAVASKELGRAMADFVRGRGHAGQSASLTDDEKAAMQEAYNRGTVDKSQSHDLVGIGDAGMQYKPTRAAIMAKVSWMFHHTERLNREVTFLAAYRMARDKGFSHEKAIEKAADLTWRIHYDYQNSSRPRILQNDWVRLFAAFKNFTVNTLWRIFRDMHQSLKGADAETRREARMQLAGVTASLFLHAGIRGMLGYSLLTWLIGMFFPDGADQVDQSIQKALVNTIGYNGAGIFMNGLPGHLLKVDLTNRIGMPDLWFQDPSQILNWRDTYTYYAMQALGASAGIGANIASGLGYMQDGQFWRGIEAASPKAMKEVMKAIRFYRKGALNSNGSAILDSFTPPEELMTLLGFTPARLAEQYRKNNMLRRYEQRIQNKHGEVLRDARDAVMQGRGITKAISREIQSFNADAPAKYQITGRSIIHSIKSRERAARESKGGVYISPSLRGYIERELAPDIYNR